jgi:hypothetical protein|tara:strand:+ start:730 stop:1872 length:1143 start_codon:yes stop_codon:yes gene_type:complete
MKISQFNAKVTAEQMNQTLAQMFGESIDLKKFTMEQLESAKTRTINKISTLQAQENLATSEEYQKQRMFLDVINAAIEGGMSDIHVGAQEIVGEYQDEPDHLAKPKAEVIADLERRKADAKDSTSQYTLSTAIDMVEKGFDDQGDAIPDPSDMAPENINTDTMKATDLKTTEAKGKDQCQHSNCRCGGKDHDKDGDVDSKDYMKSKDIAIKKAMKKEDVQVKEGAEENAQLVMAAKDMVDKITGWMEDTASMQTESMLELSDAIRDEVGSEQSESFVNQVKPALESLYSALEVTRTSLTGGVAVLTGETVPATMGTDTPEEPVVEPTDDIADVPADDFGASEPATGGDLPADRGKRESILRMSRRLAETLSAKSTGKKKA